MATTLMAVLFVYIFITSNNFIEQINADTSHTKRDITYDAVYPIVCANECGTKAPGSTLATEFSSKCNFSIKSIFWSSEAQLNAKKPRIVQG